jgi:hypothetical protein
MQPGPNWQEKDLQSFKVFLEQMHQMVATAAIYSQDMTVREKCSRIELLFRVTLQVIDLDLEDNSHNGYIKGKLNNAINQYGLEVVVRQPAII